MINLFYFPGQAITGFKGCSELGIFLPFLGKDKPENIVTGYTRMANAHFNWYRQDNAI